MVTVDISKLSKYQLQSLLDRGILQITMIDQPTNRFDTPEYQAVANLRGTPIHIGAASRKYDIPNQTITRWVQKGLINKLGKDGNKVLIDEADIAYCASVYHAHPGQGRWLFNVDGTPR